MKTLLWQSAFTLLNTLAKQYSHIGLAINKKYEKPGEKIEEKNISDNN